jgi:hypothetical protein
MKQHKIVSTIIENKYFLKLNFSSTECISNKFETDPHQKKYRYNKMGLDEFLENVSRNESNY